MAALDCLLIFPPYVAVDGVMPLAPALLKSCLMEAGFTAKTLDLNKEFRLQFPPAMVSEILTMYSSFGFNLKKSTHDRYQEVMESEAARILAMGARWIGLSAFSYHSHQFIEDLCWYLKKSDPNCKIMVGGSNIDMVKYDFPRGWIYGMLESELIDTACLGEGEQVIIDIVRNDLTGVQKQIQLLNSDLASLPVPNFDDYDQSLYGEPGMAQVPITASKGCVRACNFCDVAKMWPKFKYRKGEEVANEIIELHTKYNVSKFRFTDSLINGGLKPFRIMNEILAERLPQGVNYWGQFVCRSKRDMPPRDFELMKRGGCTWVGIGIESGSERVRDHMKKQFSNEDIHYTASELIRNNIVQQWNIFVGYPTETEEDFQDTLDLLDQYAQYTDLVKIVPIGLFKMIPGTPIVGAHYIDELGIVFDQETSSDDAWTVATNPSNTLEERYSRWLRLLATLEKNNQIKSAQGFDILSERRDSVQKMMEQYTREKNKAVVRIKPTS